MEIRVFIPSNAIKEKCAFDGRPLRGNLTGWKTQCEFITAIE